MSSTTRGWIAVACATILSCGAQLSAPHALADPPPPPDPVVAPDSGAGPETGPVFGPGPHNVTYRARVDGVSRGASITYKLSDDAFNTADPTLVPGRVFEATGVVSDPQEAGMQLSIQWPYSASLHCEILVDDQILAMANQFVAPRFTPQREQDPGYGVLSCGRVTNFPKGNTEPIDAPPPPADLPPPDPNAPPPVADPAPAT